jgi:hypothetical protein
MVNNHLEHWIKMIPYLRPECMSPAHSPFTTWYHTALVLVVCVSQGRTGVQYCSSQATSATPPGSHPFGVRGVIAPAHSALCATP